MSNWWNRKINRRFCDFRKNEIRGKLILNYDVKFYLIVLKKGLMVIMNKGEREVIRDLLRFKFVLFDVLND